MNMLRRFFEVLAVLVVLWAGVSIFNFGSELISPQEPITVSQVKQVGMAGDGRPLVVDVTRMKHRDCPSTWDTFLIEKGSGLQFSIQKGKKGSAVGVGKNTIRLQYPLPPDLPPGTYKYVAIGTYHGICGDRIYRQPPTLVTIE